MKKLIFLISFLLYSFYACSQDRIVCTLSSYWNNNRSEWSYSKLLYNYNDEDLLNIKTRISWDSYHKRWEYESRDTRKYNDQEDVTETLVEYSASGLHFSSSPVTYFEYTYNEKDEAEMIIKSWKKTKANKHLNDRRDTISYKSADKQLTVQYNEEWLLKLPNGLRLNEHGQVVLKKIKNSCRDYYYDYHIEYYPDGRYKGFLSYYIDGLTGEKYPFKKVIHIYESNDLSLSLEKPDKTFFERQIFSYPSDTENQASTLKQQKLPNFHFDLYPNPSEHDIYIKPSTKVDSFLKIDIHDYLGRLIYHLESIEQVGEEIKLATKNLTPGLYIVTIKTETHMGTKRFIKAN